MMSTLGLEREPGVPPVSQALAYSAHPRSLSEYAADLSRNGVRVLPGGSSTFWTAYGPGALMRQPSFYLAPPPAGEIRRVLWRARALLASYMLEPDADHRANAWLYSCSDHNYGFEKLDRSKRSHARTGLRELCIAPLTAEQLLAQGAAAYCDTCRRLGLSDGTKEAFRQYITGLSRLPEYVFLGAWKDAQLAAFLVILEVDHWADIQGTFSMDVLRRYRPNETLLYTALHQYLAIRRYRLVSNGVSSLAEASNAAGLHQFKTEVGFEARPVHRAFVLHPLLRPLANRLTLRLALQGVNTAAHCAPANRLLRKTSGMLSSVLGDTHMLDTAAGGTTPS
jgi:hypothetical protein